MNAQNQAVKAGFLDAVSQFFATTRLTVILLLTLAATSIIGTLIPQNESPTVYFQAYGEFWYRLFSVFDLFDMYHSWWFQLLLLLLTLNIVVCSIDRLSSQWKIVFAKNPKFKASRFRRLPHNYEFVSDHSPQALEQLFQPLLSRRFQLTTVEPSGRGMSIFAEKWRWTRLGVYFVHCSVILLLIGGLIGSIFGFEGFVTIPEGETVNSIRLRNTSRVRPLPFAIRCDDFDVSFYPTGAPREFRSALSILEGGDVTFKKEIIVNDPLRYKGISIYQSSYGKMTPEAPAAMENPPEEITLKFTSQEDQTAIEKTVRLGQEVELPRGQGRFVLKEYRGKALFGGQNIGETLIGEIIPETGERVEVMLPVHFPNFDKMRQGQVLISVVGDKWVSARPQHPAKERYYTGLQVARDPGVWVVYTGFMMMIAGCFITFFMSHQQFMVEIDKQGKKTRVVVAATANKNKLGLPQKVDALGRRLSELRGNK